MRLIFACSLFTLASCKGPAVAPRDAAADAVSVAPAHTICPPAPAGVALHLPAIERSSTIIDGAPTGEHPPSVHALPDGRFMLYDGYNGGIVMLWDPRTRALTRLMQGTLVPVTGQGYLIRTQDEQQRTTLSDIDPDRPALRPLWSDGEPGQHLELAGLLDGAPAFVIRDFRYDQDVVFGARVARPPRLLCVRGPGAAAELPLDLPDDREVASSDAIRGHRILLHGRDMPERGEEPFTVPVEILDLDEGTHRKLGDIDGAWTITTAIPHPYVVVHWLDHDERIRDAWPGERERMSQVDPATERLR